MGGVTGRIRTAAILLVLCLLFSGAQGVYGLDRTQGDFLDVSQGDWFYPYVQYAVQQGLMLGNSDTEFDPQGTTTRAMVVTVLYRMAGSPAAGESGFLDVPRSEWYARSVDWAWENGVVIGYDNGCFGPNDPVTREQLVAFQYRFVCYMGGQPEQRANLNIFQDRQNITSYALPAMKWAVGAGLLNGRTETELAPQGYATRAELAAFLYKLREKVLQQDAVMHPETVNVPVLMFHSITQEPENTDSMTAEAFDRVLGMLYAGGYETISYEQLLDYVDNGTPLPEKPVILTLDDGYEDNLQYAYPILKKYGFCGEIAVIGCYVGQSAYEGSQIIPHFSLEDVLALEPGVIQIQSHTMRMHMLWDRTPLSLGRRGVGKRTSETQTAYQTALREDFQESYDQIASVLSAPLAMTYPYGIYTLEAEQAAKAVGYPISVTIEKGGNIITVGNRDSLRLLNRVSVKETTTLEEFEAMIQVD